MWSAFRLVSGSETSILQPVCLLHSVCFVGPQGQEAEMRTVEETVGASPFLPLPRVTRSGPRLIALAAVVAERTQPFEPVVRGKEPLHCRWGGPQLVETVQQDRIHLPVPAAWIHHLPRQSRDEWGGHQLF